MLANYGAQCMLVWLCVANIMWLKETQVEPYLSIMLNQRVKCKIFNDISQLS